MTKKKIDTKKAFEKMAFSYSRLQAFHDCPYKWYHNYILRTPQKGKDFFDVGHICHSVAEDVSNYVSFKNFETMLKIYDKKNGLELLDEDGYMAIYSGEIGDRYPNSSGLSWLKNEVKNSIDPEEYVAMGMPDKDVIDKFFVNAVAKHGVTDEAVIEDARQIINRWSLWKDFYLTKDEVMISERKVAFDKEWNYLKDFFADDVFFRGVIDNIVFSNGLLIITDYKSSRTMIKESDMPSNMQLKIYLTMLYHMLPKGSIENVIVRLEYMRFLKHVEYNVTDIEKEAEEAKAWINETIALIKESVDKDEFTPKRSSNCQYCDLREDGICPLFKRSKTLGDYDNVVSDIESCKTQWKQAERLDVERKAIVSQCKSFIKNTTDPVVVDNNAKLGFYTKLTESIDPGEAFFLLRSKGIDVEDIINFFTISKTSFDKAVKRLKLDISDEEYENVVRDKYSTTFDAKTPDELDKFINI